MKILIAVTVGVMLFAGCTAEEKTVEAPVADATTSVGEPTAPTATEPAVASAKPVDTTTASQTTDNENLVSGAWSGQIMVAQPVSMFNYVGAESGDFAPMRFRNDSDAGKKILAACADDDLCEFTGLVEWLDEIPPPDASAIGQIVRVDSVKRLPPSTP
jgi:hypothetical protein